MQADDGIQKRVFAIVANHRGVSPLKLTPQSDLYQDLGCTGDDVDILFLDLQKRFGIDFSGFQFDRHFTPEAAPIWPWHLDAWLWSIGLLVASVFCGVVAAAARWKVEGPFLFCGIVILVWAWGYLGNRILPGPRRWERQRIPVKVSDLVEAARTKAWPIKYESNVK